MQLKKKLVSSLFMLISCKSVFITIINYLKTHLSIIYNKFMQLPQKKLVSSLFMIISWKPKFIPNIETRVSNIYNKFMQLPQKN